MYLGQMAGEATAVRVLFLAFWATMRAGDMVMKFELGIKDQGAKLTTVYAPYGKQTRHEVGVDVPGDWTGSGCISSR